MYKIGFLFLGFMTAHLICSACILMEAGVLSQVNPLWVEILWKILSFPLFPFYEAVKPLIIQTFPDRDFVPFVFLLNSILWSLILTMISVQLFRLTLRR